MKRGVVMSIQKQHAVVMTADGQFLRAPISGMPKVGEEIVFDEEYKHQRKFKPAYWCAGAAAVLFILFVPLLLFIQRDTHPVVAYLSMDINPSVEIGVDGEEKVRELRALNEDGKLIIEGLAYRGIDVQTVAASILERAKGSHYLDTPDKDIVVTSVIIGDKAKLKLDFESILTKKVDQTLRELLTALAEEEAEANVTTLSVPNEVRDAASANGISSGKMAVYLMAKEEGYELELEQLKLQSIDQVTEQLGGVETIIANAADTSKEKLKELVAREQEEKVKQKEDDNKSDSAEPSASPKPNKPDKAEKPGKPSSSGADKAGETDKPNKPNKPDKPDKKSNQGQSTSSANQPKDNGKDKENRGDRRDRKDDDSDKRNSEDNNSDDGRSDDRKNDSNDRDMDNKKDDDNQRGSDRDRKTQDDRND
ncbi:anti-sigma-I factor RsgI family protein [Paenibacillus harenae]|uniref:anti-sigma-I factor RsgI family protein n=1 Tax=Paenibacillus harenae TaxID=306543 RepID=UPI0003F50601|nr:anti-sigma factor domain-containing protein [Paenibacillus harenae]